MVEKPKFKLGDTVIWNGIQSDIIAVLKEDTTTDYRPYIIGVKKQDGLAWDINTRNVESDKRFYNFVEDVNEYLSGRYTNDHELESMPENINTPEEPPAEDMIDEVTLKDNDPLEYCKRTYKTNMTVKAVYADGSFAGEYEIPESFKFISNSSNDVWITSDNKLYSGYLHSSSHYAEIVSEPKTENPMGDGSEWNGIKTNPTVDELPEPVEIIGDEEPDDECIQGAKLELPTDHIKPILGKSGSNEVKLPVPTQWMYGNIKITKDLQTGEFRYFTPKGEVTGAITNLPDIERISKNVMELAEAINATKYLF